MTYSYDFDLLNASLKKILEKNLPSQTWEWLAGEGEKARRGDIAKFNIAFVAMPRKTGKNVVSVAEEDESALQKHRKGLRLRGWTADRLSRVWLLMQLRADDKDKYLSAIENLFMNAEMGELVALYTSLPLLAYPEAWRKRCAEGIRSNIGQVLTAVICNNPYPAEHLEEAEWNQLVLKAIFTEQRVLDIEGLRARRNVALARSLSDYAHERWAAHRQVNPLLWICTAPFIDSDNFSDIQRIFDSEDPQERNAAALVCHESTFAPAKKLLEQNPELKGNIERGLISWQRIAEQMA